MAFGDITQTASNSEDYPAANVQVTITSSTSGNLLVCVHFTGANDSQAPTEGGWAEAVTVNDGGNSDDAAIYWKKTTGGETTVTPTSDAGDEQMAIVYEIVGPWAADPTDVSATNGATSVSTTSSGTTGTTSAASAFAVTGCTLRSILSAFDTWTNSYTESAEGGVHSSDKGMASAYKLLSATATQETSCNHDSGVAMGLIAVFLEDVGGAAANPKGPLGHVFHGPFGGPI